MTDIGVTSIITTYRQRISAKPYVSSATYGRTTMGPSGVPNKMFITFLFSDHDVGVQFLKFVGLYPSSMVCCKCGWQMTWCVDSIVKDGYRGRYMTAISASTCRVSTSVRHGTRFQQSNMNFMEVVFLTHIVRRVPARTIQQKHQFGSASITDWSKFCREVMFGYVLVSPQKIGCPNKTVEIDESKFARRKYNRGHKVKGQWVLVVLSASPEKHF